MVFTVLHYIVLIRVNVSINRVVIVIILVMLSPINPTPMAVTTMVTSTRTSAVKPTATAASPTPIQVTVYNLAQSRIQEIPNSPIRKFQGEEDPSTPNCDNAHKVQQPKAAATATAPQTREDTPWPASTNLFVARASWPIPTS